MDNKISIETGFLLSLFQNSLNISCIVFNREMKVIYSSSPDQIAERILLENPAFQELFKTEQTYRKPLLFGSSLGTTWVACFSKEEYAYLLGPFLSSDLSDRIAEETLNQYPLSLSLKRKIMNYIETVPVVNYNSIYSYAIMLHHVLNGEKISTSDIEIYTTKDSEEKIKVPKKDRIRTWKAEQQLMKNIEEGNMEFKDSLNTARRVSYGMRISTGNPSRQIKNSVLTFISLSARAAIRGGMTPEMAYSISDMYVEKIERADQINELAALSDQMYQEYISRVHEIRKQKRHSLPVQTVIDYIELHLEEDLALSTLADLSGYSEYYLSRMFKKETGTSINSYINQKKIEYAASLIELSELTIAEIAEKLNYASETYFSTVFKKITGMSPAQYRYNTNHSDN